MRYENRLVRIGEYLGPLDESFDFDTSSSTLSPNPSWRAKLETRIRRLASVPESELGDWYATTDGGWPRFGWHRVLTVGMYDGWPHWKPWPSVCSMGPLGPEWHSYGSITNIRNHKTGETL